MAVASGWNNFIEVPLISKDTCACRGIVVVVVSIWLVAGAILLKVV